MLHFYKGMNTCERRWFWLRFFSSLGFVILNFIFHHEKNFICFQLIEIKATFSTGSNYGHNFHKVIEFKSLYILGKNKIQRGILIFFLETSFLSMFSPLVEGLFSKS